MTFTRYAIFHVPPPGADWVRFCTGWLGWDIETGRAAVPPDLRDLPLPRTEITCAPRRYGFHATVKPPFRPVKGTDPADLARTLAEICARHAPVCAPPLRLVRMGRFLALRPPEENAALAALHVQVLRSTDRFRAPLTPAERARRRAAPLSPRQEAHLSQWGYPYVLQDFRFHYTLSGRLPGPALGPVAAALNAALAPLLPATCEIADLALVGEDAAGMFHLLSRCPLSG